MTNGEKYKTAKERAEACMEYYRENPNPDKPYITCAMEWLDLEAEAEEPMPCPFCGATNSIMCETNSDWHWLVRCYSCGYMSKSYGTKDSAIEAHNRVARAAKEAD